jgi:prephenate dehydrogenase
MSRARAPVINAVILGGNGAIGSLFCSMLAGERIAATAIDVSPAPTAGRQDIGYVSADVRAMSAEARRALAAADWVIAALPEAVLLETWETILGNLKQDALFVDTLSVKLPFMNAVAGRLPARIEVVSINPMFAPALGFQGQSVAVVEVRRAGHADHFLELLQKWGASLQMLSAEQHDRYAALLQTVTHAAILAFGLALRRLDYDLETVLPVMTPPHRAMLALLARILSASPEVYWDIQVQNPCAPEARQALESGLQELSRLIDGGDQRGFLRLLDELRDLFGAKQLDNFNRHSTSMLAAPERK